MSGKWNCKLKDNNSDTHDKVQNILFVFYRLPKLWGFWNESKRQGFSKLPSKCISFWQKRQTECIFALVICCAIVNGVVRASVWVSVRPKCCFIALCFALSCCTLVGVIPEAHLLLHCMWIWVCVWECAVIIRQHVRKNKRKDGLMLQQRQRQFPNTKHRQQLLKEVKRRAKWSS